MAESQPILASSAPQLNETPVEYRDIEGFPGYRVGSDGSVWTCLEPGGKSRKWRIGTKWRPLKGSTCGRHRDYRLAFLHKNGSVVAISFHRLVLSAFVGPPVDGQVACHCNGNSLDNRLCNLRWGSVSENYNDSRTHGTCAIGERNGTSKLSAGDVVAIRAAFALGVRRVDLARRYQVRPGTIAFIVERKTWKHIA